MTQKVISNFVETFFLFSFVVCLQNKNDELIFGGKMRKIKIQLCCCTNCFAGEMQQKIMNEFMIEKRRESVNQPFLFNHKNFFLPKIKQKR